MFKDMTDEGLASAILSLQNLAWNASQMKSMRLGHLLRELDIAIAVKRSRIRADTWTLPL